MTTLRLFILFLIYSAIDSYLVIPLEPKCIESFQTECLRTHNEVRAKHAALPLNVNKTLTKLAMNHSQYLASIEALIPMKKTNLSEYAAVIYSSKTFNQTGSDCSSKYSILI